MGTQRGNRVSLKTLVVAAVSSINAERGTTHDVVLRAVRSTSERAGPPLGNALLSLP